MLAYNPQSFVSVTLSFTVCLDTHEILHSYSYFCLKFYIRIYVCILPLNIYIYKVEICIFWISSANCGNGWYLSILWQVRFWEVEAGRGPCWVSQGFDPQLRHCFLSIRKMLTKSLDQFRNSWATNSREKRISFNKTTCETDQHTDLVLQWHWLILWGEKKLCTMWS